LGVQMQIVEVQSRLASLLAKRAELQREWDGVEAGYAARDKEVDAARENLEKSKIEALRMRRRAETSMVLFFPLLCFFFCGLYF
jgi:hypothetical protein